ncbi:MAG: hypothetical protein IK100_03900 [Muribaculaceae bacterium]|nr:hypothetical protein [Muribaculaceae bacterium]MBR5171371.1 hypothetical protein [Muribaculaceae bacterium]
MSRNQNISLQQTVLQWLAGVVKKSLFLPLDFVLLGLRNGAKNATAKVAKIIFSGKKMVIFYG